MISLMFLLGLFGLLFVVGFATRRRFGVLGLALAAGSLLSAQAGAVSSFIEQQGVELVVPPLITVVQVALIILPPLLFIFTGPAYQNIWARILGSAAFALVAFALLLQPLGGVLHLEAWSLRVVTFFDTYQTLIISIGMIGALADMLLAGRHSKAKKRSEH